MKVAIGQRRVHLTDKDLLGVGGEARVFPPETTPGRQRSRTFFSLRFSWPS